MAAESKTEQPRLLLAPLPQTERGFGIHVDVTNHGKRMAYTNSNNVIIRSLENPADAQVFSKHNAKANVARFSPNGELIASGDDTGKVIIWLVKTQAIKKEIPIGKRVLDIAWSDDGSKLVAVGDGAELKARVVAADTGNNVGEIGGHNKSILSVSYSASRPFHIVTSSEDFGVNFYGGPPFKFVSSNQESTNFVNCVRFSPAGDQYVSVGADRQIMFFDGKTGEKTAVIDSKMSHDGGIYSVCWSPDGTRILTASGDKTVKMWNVADKSLITTFTFGETTNDMQVSCAWLGDLLISVSLSGEINYLDPDQPNKPKRIITGHQDVMTAMTVIAPHTIITGDNSGYICRWDAKTGEATRVGGAGHGKPISALAVNSTQDTLVSVGLDDRLIFSDLKENTFGDALPLDGQPTSVATSASNPLLVAVTIAQKKLCLIEDKKLKSCVELKYRPNTVAISPDNSVIAVGGDDKKVHVFTTSGALAESKQLTNNTQSVLHVSFSNDGKFLTATDKDRSAFFYDTTQDFKCLNTFGWKYHNSAVSSAEWSPSNTKLATCSIDRSWIVFYDSTNAAGNKNRTHLLTHGGGLFAIRWLDEETVVTAGDDRVIKVWDVAPSHR